MLASKRAENPDEDTLSDTFVPIEALSAILQSPEHHVLFGRRGTGKTHMLRYLAAAKRGQGAAAIYVDLRTIGSSAGVYGDTELSVASRATTLLVDVISAIHAEIYELVLSSEPFVENLHFIGPALDDLANVVTGVHVKGTVEKESGSTDTEEQSRSTRKGMSISRSPSLDFGSEEKRSERHDSRTRRVERGVESFHIVFGELTSALKKLVDALPGPLWILLDEWSSLPIELQPFLADLLRRNAFTVKGITVKIGAIQRRSRFIQTGARGDYLGLELGSDTSATQDIDDYLVFEYGRRQVSDFFAELLHRHVVHILRNEGADGQQLSVDEFVAAAFADRSAFSRLVLGSEGVPRDALQIAAVSAGLAASEPITDREVNRAERDYFSRDKEGRISEAATRALADMVDACVDSDTRLIALRRPVESFTDVVQELYDARLIHRRTQNVALPGEPFHEKYDTFLVDFGCFAELVQVGRLRAVDDGGPVIGIVRTASRSLDSRRNVGPVRIASAAGWRRGSA